MASGNGLSLFGPDDDQEPGDGVDTEAAFFAWDGEQVDYSDAMLTRGRSYGSYVNTGPGPARRA